MITIAAQGIFVLNVAVTLFRSAKARDTNPWRAASLEWTGNRGRFRREMTVHRGAYEFFPAEIRGGGDDFVPQNAGDGYSPTAPCRLQSGCGSAESAGLDLKPPQWYNRHRLRGLRDSMPGTDVLDEIDLVVEDTGRGGGGKPPDRDEHRGGGGDDGNFRPRRPNPSQSGQRRYQTAILLGMVSICMFFMALSAAFLVRKTGKDWINFRLPSIIWVNTIVLLTSSLTIDLARRRLALNDLIGFQDDVARDDRPGRGFRLSVRS